MRMANIKLLVRDRNSVISRLQKEVADLKKALAAKEKQELEFRMAYENSLDAIFLTAPDGRIFSANPAACQMFGYSEEEMCRGGRDLFLDYSDPRIEKAIKHRDKSGFFLTVMTYRRKDGTHFEGECSSKIFLDKEGRKFSSIIVRDLTSRLALERSVRDTETLFNLALKNSGVSIAKQDLEQRTTWISEKSEISKNKVIGLTDFALLDQKSAEKLKKLKDQVISTGKGSSIELWVKRLDKQLYIDLHLEPLCDNNRKVTEIAVLIIDKTAEKRTEEQLRRLNTQLKIALNTSNAFSWEYNLTDKILYWSFETENPPVIINIGNNGLTELHKYVTKDNLNQIVNTFEECLAHKRNFDIEFPSTSIEGIPKWFRAVGMIYGEETNDKRIRGIAVDITALKKIEELKIIKAKEKAEVEILLAKQKSEESEREYHNLMNEVNDGFFITDLEGKIQYGNKKLAEIFGIESQQELTGRKALDFVPPSQQAYWMEKFTESLINRTDPQSVELEIQRPDGTSRHIETRPSMMIQDGKVKSVRGIVRDITDRIRLELKLKETEKYFRTLIEKTPDGIALLGKDAKIIYASPSARKMFEYPDDVFDYQDPDDAVHPDDLPKLDSHLFRILEEPSYLPSCDFRYRTYSGKWKWISATFSNQLEVKGLEAIIINFKDITEDKIAQDKLETNERILKLFVEYAPASIAMLDRDMRYLAISKRFLKDYRLKEQEIIGRSHYEIFPEINDRWLAIHRKCLQGAVEKCDEDLFVRANGEIDWIRWEIHPWYETKEKIGGILLFSEVITERKVAQEEIRMLNERLEQKVKDRTEQLEAVNRDLESFSYSVSHDLAAPLRAISGFSKIIIEDYGPSLDNNANQLLTRIAQSSSRMQLLIGNLMRLSNINKYEKKNKRINISECVKVIMADFAGQSPQRNAELKIQDGLFTFCDETLAQILLQNLLSNAWKYSSRKPVSVIEFGRVKKRGENVFFIKDNGTGFDQKYAEIIFKPFQRLHKSDDFEGSGIGLATVERIIQRHDGKIWAESQPEQGTVIYFRF
jgi:PAS domain S-box-containing protein